MCSLCLNVYIPFYDMRYNILQMIVAGYILSVYSNLQEEQRRLTPGNTPVRRRNNSSQTQAMIDSTTTPSAVSFSQNLIQGELAQQMFSYVYYKFFYIVYIMSLLCD